ncbi:MAG: EAL domain-containing protein [Tissierellia bacterium]|nr:EAL domain-containing protein [Tissierellia bacterium]
MNDLRSTSKNTNLFRILLILLLLAAADIIVYLTDGTRNVYLQLFYIPLILSSYYWNIKGGLCVAIVSGILLGPFMPLSVSEGIMQSTSNWIIRMLIYIFIGSITGYAFKKMRQLEKEAQENNLINPLTGIYNTNKLLSDLEKRINEDERFTVISIKLTNIEAIEKYLDYNIIKEIIKDLVSELKHGCGKEAIYSTSNDEIILIACKGCLYMKKINNAILKYSNPVKVKKYIFRLSLKIGMYDYSGDYESPIAIFNKARIAYEQGEIKESGIYYYRDELEEQRRKTIEITGALLEAVKNDELYLVYQPKINIIDNLIEGVEVLLRWDRSDKESIEPDQFIRIAEEIGFIKEITKFVIKNAVNQIIEWENKGIKINYSINITAKELHDKAFMEWTKRFFENNKIDRSKFEIEITERVFAKEGKKLFDILQELRNMGYMVSIDDFGTGINSLMSIVKFPIDILKIDKYFIDRLDQYNIRRLIKAIIDYAHKVKLKVIAEGVETEKQLRVLKKIKCDMVQGYYYSKPLLPNEFEIYYNEFNELRNE